MARFLTDADVNQCVGLPDMLSAIESMMASYGRGEAVNMTRRKITTPNGYLAVMGGGLFYDGVFGVKTFTFTTNGYSFQVSLYDAASGNLLLYTQANRLGQLRTGATTGAALRLLANTDIPRLGVIGTGNQAGDQLRAACAVRDVGEIYAYSRNPENRRAFAERMSQDLGRPVVPAETNQEAVADCAIVIGIAPAATPVIRGEWLADGATVIGAGPTRPTSLEVDDAVLTRASRLFLDSLEQAPLECGDINAAVDRGLVRWSQFHEIRHVAAGLVPGRAGADEIVYCKLMGTGLADVAAAKLALDRAKELEIGVDVDW